MVAVTILRLPFALSIVVVSIAAVKAVKIVISYYNKKEDKIIWKPVGKVTELTIYPLKYGEGNSLKKVYCTQNGLRSMEFENLRDGCIVIYEKRSKRLFTEENMYLENIKIECNINSLILKSPGLGTMTLDFRDIDLTFTTVTVHAGEIIPVRDCGDSAAKWVSQILKNEEKELRLGYYAMDYHKNKNLRELCEKFVKNMAYFTRNGIIFHPDFSSPILINSDSIAGVSSTIKSSISPSNFNPNILFSTVQGHPLQEYTWKKVKIGNVEFDCIKPCDHCIVSRKDFLKSSIEVDIPKFMKALKASLQKYVDFKIKDPAYVGINLKLCGKDGSIKVNDEVYVMC